MSMQIDKLTAIPATPGSNKLLLIKEPAKLYVDAHVTTSDGSATHPLISQSALDSRIDELAAASVSFKESINSVADQYTVTQLVFVANSYAAGVGTSDTFYSTVLEDIDEVEHIVVRILDASTAIDATLAICTHDYGNSYLIPSSSKDIFNINMPGIGIPELVYTAGSDFTAFSLKARSNLILKIVSLNTNRPISGDFPVQIVLYGRKRKGEQLTAFAPTLDPTLIYLNKAKTTGFTLHSQMLIFANDTSPLEKGIISMDVDGALFRVGEKYGTFTLTASAETYLYTGTKSFTFDAIALTSQSLGNAVCIVPADVFPSGDIERSPLTYMVGINYDGYVPVGQGVTITPTDLTKGLQSQIVDMNGSILPNPFPLVVPWSHVTIKGQPAIFDSVLPCAINIPVTLYKHTPGDMPVDVLNIGDTYVQYATVQIYDESWVEIFNSTLPAVATKGLEVSIDLTPVDLAKYSSHLPEPSAMLYGYFPVSSNWYSITFGNGIFVAVAQNTSAAATSPDGITWTQYVLPTSDWWSAIAFGNGVFVAVPFNSNIAVTSPDGVVWTQHVLPASTSWQTLTFGNGLFVAIATTSFIYVTSPDGITWTQRSLPISANWNAVTFGNGVFVAVANNPNTVVTSPDAITWTQSALPATSSWYSIAYGNGVFVAVAFNLDIAATSPDGITWTQRIMPASNQWYGVTFGNGIFIAISRSSMCATSLDGVIWVISYLPYYDNWCTLAFGNGVAVTIGMASGLSIAITIDSTPITVNHWYYVQYSIIGQFVPGYVFVDVSENFYTSIITDLPITVSHIVDTTLYQATIGYPYNNGDFINVNNYSLNTGDSYGTVTVDYLAIVNNAIVILTTEIAVSAWDASKVGFNVDLTMIKCPEATVSLGITYNGVQTPQQPFIPKITWQYHLSIVAPVQLAIYIGSVTDIEAQLYNQSYDVNNLFANLEINTAGTSVRVTIKEHTATSYLLDVQMPWINGDTASRTTDAAPFDLSTLSLGKYIITLDNPTYAPGSTMSTQWPGYTPGCVFDAGWVGVSNAVVNLDIFEYTLDIASNNTSTRTPSGIVYDATTGTAVISFNLLLTGSYSSIPGDFNTGIDVSIITPNAVELLCFLTSYVLENGYMAVTQLAVIDTPWVEYALPLSAQWRAVGYGNNIFVAVAFNSDICATSPDGITWTQQTLPSSGYWQDVIFANGVFLALAYGYNIVATSPDGVTWTQHTLPVINNWYALAFGNGVFVAIANSSNVATTSSDGITWSPQTLPSQISWCDVAFGNGVFVTVANNSAICATSPDGITWTQRALSSLSNCSAVAFGNGLFVITSTNSSTTFVSTNGITWTQGVMPLLTQWTNITYGNGLFVAFARYNGVSATSTDGITWNIQQMPSTNWSGLTYGNGVFVATNIDNGAAIYSPATAPAPPANINDYVLKLVGYSADVNQYNKSQDYFMANSTFIDETVINLLTAWGVN